MKNNKGTWIVIIIIAALIGIAIWLLTSPSIDNDVNQDYIETNQGIVID